MKNKQTWRDPIINTNITRANDAIYLRDFSLFTPPYGIHAHRVYTASTFSRNPRVMAYGNTILNCLKIEMCLCPVYLMYISVYTRFFCLFALRLFYMKQLVTMFKSHFFKTRERFFFIHLCVTKYTHTNTKPHHTH